MTFEEYGKYLAEKLKNDPAQIDSVVNKILNGTTKAGKRFSEEQTSRIFSAFEEELGNLVQSKENFDNTKILSLIQKVKDKIALQKSKRNK